MIKITRIYEIHAYFFTFVRISFSFLLLSLNLSSQNYKVPVSEEDEPMLTGKFEPSWESFKEYKVPEWFKNATFGIWAHWGPQCVEGFGDWMARKYVM